MRTFIVKGMSCAACSARVEKAVRSLKDIDECQVNLLTNSMTVSGKATDEAIQDAVSRAGYAAFRACASEQPTESIKKRTGVDRTLLRLCVSAVLLIGLMYVSMGHGMWGFPLPRLFVNHPMATMGVQAILALAVMLINSRFYKRGFRALVTLSPNMDTLVALGSTAAFVYSLFVAAVTVFGLTDALQHVYFESAAMIVTLVSVGKWLEERAKGKTTDAIRSLMSMAPQKATVLRDGMECVVPCAQVNVGDLVVSRTGESIAVDGIVRKGRASIDESSMTGESVPVDKEIGDTVSASTINRGGYLEYEATRVGEDTAFSQIIRIVSETAASKAPIAKTADRVAGIFVPLVIGLALITMTVWLFLGESFGYALQRGISVLVISCPCALGLATPVAIMVGSGVGARRGILFKTATALELSGRVRTIVFDKTGTLTKGDPNVTKLLLPQGVSEEELLSKAASLEHKSEHPLSRAVMNYVSQRNIHPTDASQFEVVAGRGLCGVVDGVSVRGGNAAYIEEVTHIPDDVKVASEALAKEGHTPLCFAQDGHFLGCITVADVLREDSRQTVDRLHRMGLSVIMLTGDREDTARAIGQEAGVDRVIAGVLPAEKHRVIGDLQQQGFVMMVGDGVNDAPALTRADVGVAIGAGTDVAIDAADVVLVNNRLSDVCDTVYLGQRVLRTIRQNLWWAFAYNVIGIPLAAGVWAPLFSWDMNPMFGAAAMSVSSVCVVLNALRLNSMFRGLQKQNRNRKENTTMIKTIRIEGMMCPHCSGRVRDALTALCEVDSAEVSHETGTAVVTLNTAVSDEVLHGVVTAQGYTVVG